MKIGIFPKQMDVALNEINIINLEMLIKRIKKIKNRYCNYVTKIYNKYRTIILSNKKRNIYEGIKQNFKSLVNLDENIGQINNCKVIISPSHDYTYYITRKLLTCKDQKVLIICFDMHSDTYDYSDKLWKGNIFSKLLKESVIEKLLVIGVPSNKIKKTKSDIPSDIKESIIIRNKCNIESEINKLKPDTVFVSIDIDCLDTYKNAYTALEYCPMTILSNLSRINLGNKNKQCIIDDVVSSIFVKNDLGYANLFKVGEKGLTIDELLKYIKKLKKYCYKSQVNLGLCNGKVIADISEVYGYDYNDKTLKVITSIIDELTKKEV